MRQYRTRRSSWVAGGPTTTLAMSNGILPRNRKSGVVMNFRLRLHAPVLYPTGETYSVENLDNLSHRQVTACRLTHGLRSAPASRPQPEWSQRAMMLSWLSGLNVTKYAL
jgi:hypothetical protein